MDWVQQRGSCNSGSSSSRGCLSNLKCKCGTDAVVRTVKNGLNSGMKFYGCHSWPVSCVVVVIELGITI